MFIITNNLPYTLNCLVVSVTRPRVVNVDIVSKNICEKFLSDSIISNKNEFKYPEERITIS